MTDADLIVAVGLELRNSTGVFCTLQMDGDHALSLLGLLQLSLRHPLVIGATSKNMMAMAKTIAAGLARLGPATAALCDRGWGPEKGDGDQEGAVNPIDVRIWDGN